MRKINKKLVLVADGDVEGIAEYKGKTYEDTLLIRHLIRNDYVSKGDLKELEFYAKLHNITVVVI